MTVTLGVIVVLDERSCQSHSPKEQLILNKILFQLSVWIQMQGGTVIQFTVYKEGCGDKA